MFDSPLPFLTFSDYFELLTFAAAFEFTSAETKLSPAIPKFQ